MTVTVFGENTGDDETGVTDDTRMTFFNAATQDFNYGIEIAFYHATPSAPFSQVNALLRFDISALPGGDSISSAIISLEHRHGGCLDHTGDTLSDLFSILSGNDNWWPEGTKDSTSAATGEPNWDFLSKSGTAWAGDEGCNTSGTDFDATVISSETVSTGATAITFDVTAEVQAMHSSGNNYGFTLRGNGAEVATISYHSSEGTDGSRPILTVTHTAAASSLRTIQVPSPLRTIQVPHPTRTIQVPA